MKNIPIIKRYVNAGLGVLAGNFKFSEALNFLCSAARALRSIAKRVGKYFALFFSCGASSLDFEKIPPFREAIAEPHSHTLNYQAL